MSFSSTEPRDLGYRNIFNLQWIAKLNPTNCQDLKILTCLGIEEWTLKRSSVNLNFRTKHATPSPSF